MAGQNGSLALAGSRNVEYDQVESLVDRLKEEDLRKLFIHVKELLSFDMIARLQVHVVEIIFSYLDAASLCAAGACSYHWRKLANKDSLWKRVCIRANVAHLSSLPPSNMADGLMNSSPSHTSGASVSVTCLAAEATIPPSDSSESDPATFLPPCHWKHVFLKSQQLLHNWKKGRYYLSPSMKGHAKSVTSIACDDSVVVSGSSDNTARVWDLQSLECKHHLEGHTDSVNDITCKDGVVVTGSADGLVRVYDLISGQYLWAMYGHSGSVDHVIVNGEIAISGGSDCVVRMWNVKTGKEIHALRGHTDEIECLWLSTEGVALSGSWDQSIRIWNLREGICKHILLGHSEVVYCCTSLSGRIVSGGGDGLVQIWHLETGMLIRSCVGHEQEVTCLQCLEDIIASASADSTVRIWDYSGVQRMAVMSSMASPH